VGGMDFSLWQIAIVLVIALLVFGPKRLPDLGRSLGSGMREFKDSITGQSKSGDDSVGGSLGSGMREFRDSISGKADEDAIVDAHVEGPSEDVSASSSAPTKTGV
jgi:TatA/E family protein of Tat protein translocase